MKAHAKLSASGSKRWMNCTPSVRLEESFTVQSSLFAEEGTVAHELAELMISERLGMKTNAELKPGYDRIEQSGFYSPDMLQSVASYVDFVIERVHAAGPGAVVMLEQLLDYSEWVEGGFGTGDVIIINDQAIEVIDLKFGKGLPVSAVLNPQLMLYGLGAIYTFGMLYEFETVRMTIHQPRLDQVSTFEMQVDELLRWGDAKVKPKAQLAAAGEGEFAPGTWCQFCKAKAVCRARAEQNLALAQYDFRAPDTLSDAEIGVVLKQGEQLGSWLSDLEKYVTGAILSGSVIEGYKVVEGRSNRKYSDERAVISVLQEQGFSKEEVCKPMELLSITELEKRITKNKFQQCIGHLIVKPQGKPTLVESSDPRVPFVAGSEFN